MSGQKQRSKNGVRALRGGHIKPVLDWLEKQNVPVKLVTDQQTGKNIYLVDFPLFNATLSLCGVIDGVINKKYYGMDDYHVEVRGAITT